MESLLHRLQILLPVALLVLSLVTTNLPAAKRPNILFILTDDQRWDAMGNAGHPWIETPHMDRLAREGARFNNAFVTTSLCSPSRASILTGLYAHNHRVVDNYNPLPNDLVFFPQYLQEAGYQTAFIGKWHMGGSIDHPQPGFDHWVSFKGQGVYWTDPERSSVQGRPVPQASATGFNINGERRPQKGYITDELTEYALDWLENRRSGDRPWFLMVSHKAVHADFIPAERHAYRYEEKPFVQPENWFNSPGQFHDVPMWVKNQMNSRHGVDYAYYMNLDLATYYRRYCETLLAVDDSLGALLKQLEGQSMLDDTLVVYTSDNGFLFGEHGLIDKRCAYEESIRVPILMRYPKWIEGGTSIDSVVANIDIAPSLLEAAGIGKPGHMDGTSFLPQARGDDTGEARKHLLYEYYWERNYPHTPTLHALRDNRYKYIRYHGVWDVDELYDLKTDPRERRNLIHSPDHQDIAKEMNEALFEELQATSGMELPLVKDRGLKFYHRDPNGAPQSEFPDWYFDEPEYGRPARR